MVESPWIDYVRPNDSAVLRLFCLPHAGGGAGSYRDWVAGLAPEVEVVPVQLPGRETRFFERPFTTITPLLDALSEALRPFLDKPFAFFGHSLGALIAFELVRRLQSDGVVSKHLFVSGYSAPHLPDKLPPMHHLDDAQFVAALQDLDTMPTAVLENEELLTLLLPLLRADFAIYEQYQFQVGEPIACPLTILGGKSDPLVPPKMLLPWHEHTTQPGEVHLFDGSHFYLHEEPTAVWQIIRQTCQTAQRSL
ncbi:MAG: putative thioesterase [Anaerolineaceae bacterium]|nr:putative thioesterase [Anaerolineaceae bacterium]